MNEAAIARALHIVGVIMWIGGVAFVTTVLLPAVRRMKTPAERVAFFEAVEGRFAWQARFTTLLVGVSGLYITQSMHLWPRFSDPAYWWMHAMIAIWLLFTLMLFVLEPLFLHRWFLRSAESKPERTFLRIEKLHWSLLSVSLLTAFAATAGSHGLLF